MHPEEVIALVRERPWAGEPWARELVETLPDRLDAVLARWDLTVVRAFTEGAEQPVLEVRGRSSGAAVLKLGGHGSDHAQQVRVLRAADGRGYVRVLDHCEEHEATLLELLEAPLHATAHGAEDEMGVLADLLPVTWELPLTVGLPLGSTGKADSLLALVEGAPAALADRHRGTLEAARDLALDLAGSPSPRQVVLHGDPHPGNVLGRGGEHVFIDPDGIVGEPEYDAGVVLRDHQQMIEERERHEPGVGRRRLAELTERLARRLELDADRVAAWALLERVTTGIHLHALGWRDEGEAWLRTASLLLR